MRLINTQPARQAGRQRASQPASQPASHLASQPTREPGSQAASVQWSYRIQAQLPPLSFRIQAWISFWIWNSESSPFCQFPNPGLGGSRGWSFRIPGVGAFPNLYYLGSFQIEASSVSKSGSFRIISESTRIGNFPNRGSF